MCVIYLTHRIRMMVCVTHAKDKDEGEEEKKGKICGRKT